MRTSDCMMRRLMWSRELWREDGKLGQTVANARSEMQTAERSLQGMMDKVEIYEPPGSDR